MILNRTTLNYFKLNIIFSCIFPLQYILCTRAEERFREENTPADQILYCRSLPVECVPNVIVLCKPPFIIHYFTIYNNNMDIVMCVRGGGG